jgi:hypothetical protein
MTFFDIVLQTQASLHPDGEPSDFISEHVGLVRCEDDAGVVRRVGKVRAWRIHADLAARYGESLFDVCDAHSQEMHEIHTLLYEPNGYGFQEFFVDNLDAMDSDCLVLDYVVLNPKWRGLKVGLLAARKAIDLLAGGCGLVVCDIAPLRRDAHQWVGVPASWIPAQKTSQARREATRKLRRYYGRLGFRRLGKTPYCAMSMARLTPTLDDLLRPRR